MSKKSTRESDVPAKFIKVGINVCSKELATLTLTLTLNSCLEKELFLENSWCVTHFQEGRRSK